MEKIRIHHLTDIHIGALHYKPAHNIPVVPAQSSPRNVALYNKWLRELPVESLPDLVVVSGDLTSYASESEMHQAQGALKEIAELIRRKPLTWLRGDDPGRVLIVPGNHDLDWTKEGHAAKIERYATMSDSLHQYGVRSPCCITPDHATPWIDFGDDANLCIALIDTTPIGGSRDPQLANIHQKLKETSEKLKETSENPQPSALSVEVEAQLKQIEIEMRKDPGYINPETFERLREGAKKSPATRIKIAVMHHNLTAVTSDDLETFDTIINAGQAKSEFVKHGFDMVLHGHRHTFDAAVERRLTLGSTTHKALRIVCGDTFGCSPSAPFLQLEISDPKHVEPMQPPFASVRVRRATFENNQFRLTGPIFEETLVPQLECELRQVMSAMSDGGVRDRDTAVLEPVTRLIPQLEALRARLIDWGNDSSKWIRNFHYQLPHYSRVFATDINTRSSLDSSNYHRYLREQYTARLQRLHHHGGKKLAFSSVVYDAIVRSDWHPDRVMWNGFDIVKDNDLARKQLEIVRILIRPNFLASEKEMLENLDFDHRMFAIPLFVVTSEDFKRVTKLQNVVDFAIGYDDAGHVIKCYEFVQRGQRGRVEEASLNRGESLAERCRDLFREHVISIIPDFGYPRPIMIRDPEEIRQFAESYDRSRCASRTLLEGLERITSQTSASISTKRALDIGCGTGNYTLPFAGKFDELVGLDANQAMLDVAKRKPKADGVYWRCEDVMQSQFPDNHFDAIWGISTIHYFTQDLQYQLLKMCRRWLKPGGVICFDTEFAEQHLSLWVVEYFPSLVVRYKNRCLSKMLYETWLRQIGYVRTDLQILDYPDADQDGFLRLGQRHPERYLDKDVREGLPAFREMPRDELDSGLRRLECDIASGDVHKTIEKYCKRATMSGDIGLIVAYK